MRIALFSNLLGAVLLFMSFQATSSDVQMISDKQTGTTALCAYGTAVLISHQGSFMVGAPPCPSFANAKPIALVSIEYPWMVTTGFVLTLLGFILQCFSFSADPKKT
jgi:hypothetical protein